MTVAMFDAVTAAVEGAVADDEIEEVVQEFAQHRDADYQGR